MISVPFSVPRFNGPDDGLILAPGAGGGGWSLVTLSRSLPLASFPNEFISVSIAGSVILVFFHRFSSFRLPLRSPREAIPSSLTDVESSSIRSTFGSSLIFCLNS